MVLCFDVVQISFQPARSHLQTLGPNEASHIILHVAGAQPRPEKSLTTGTAILPGKRRAELSVTMHLDYPPQKYSNHSRR